MLASIGIFNNLSDKLRAELEERAKAAGNRIRYRFNISHPNPDPEKFNGPIVWPSCYTLTPKRFFIQDRDSKRKEIMMVDEIDEKGKPIVTRKVQCLERMAGEFWLDLSIQEDLDTFAFIELHPKTKTGLFPDKNIADANYPVYRIEELKEAKLNRAGRNKKFDAIYVAKNYKLSEVKDFACAMGWEEGEEEDILRDRVEALADADPAFFIGFIDEDSIPYRATVKRAIGSRLWEYLPDESRVIWSSNKEPVCPVKRGLSDEGALLKEISIWLQTSKNGEEIYKRVRTMLKPEPVGR
jgi:hypothetical protein